MQRPEIKSSKAFEMFCRIEQAPDPLSRVTMSKEKGALGFPRTALHWLMGDLEKRTFRIIMETIGQQVALLNLGRVMMKEWLADDKESKLPSSVGGGWHHMGGHEFAGCKVRVIGFCW